MASYTEGEQFWLLPDLGGAANAGTKLSNYVKALQPAGRLGALKKYYSIGCDVPSLPIQSTAAGVRPGAAETLCMATPAEYAVHNTGHDLTGFSALFEYLNVRLSPSHPYPPSPRPHARTPRTPSRGGRQLRGTACCATGPNRRLPWMLLRRERSQPPRHPHLAAPLAASPSPPPPSPPLPSPRPPLQPLA